MSTVVAKEPTSSPRAKSHAVVRVFEEERSSVVHVVGELDIASSDRLESVLRTLAQRSHGRVVVDLSRVTFMDSAGLRVLVRARERMDAGGRWLLTRGATGQPRRLLEIGRIRYGLEL
jgi:anti-sigma B factor antagonist